MYFAELWLGAVKASKIKHFSLCFQTHHRDPHHFQSYRPRFIYRRVTAPSTGSSPKAGAGEDAAEKSSPRAMAAVSLAGIGSRTV